MGTRLFLSDPTLQWRRHGISFLWKVVDNDMYTENKLKIVQRLELRYKREKDLEGLWVSSPSFCVDCGAIC